MESLQDSLLVCPRSSSVISSESISAFMYSISTPILVCALSLTILWLQMPTEHPIWMVHCHLECNISKSQLFILSPPPSHHPLQPYALFLRHKTLVWSWPPCQGFRFFFFFFFFFSFWLYASLTSLRVNQNYAIFTQKSSHTYRLLQTISKLQGFHVGL